MIKYNELSKKKNVQQRNCAGSSPESHSYCCQLSLHCQHFILLFRFKIRISNKRSKLTSTQWPEVKSSMSHVACLLMLTRCFGVNSVWVCTCSSSAVSRPDLSKSVIIWAVATIQEKIISVILTYYLKECWMSVTVCHFKTSWLKEHKAGGGI